MVANSHFDIALYNLLMPENQTPIGEPPQEERKAAAIQDFLDLAKKGEINRESIVEGWRQFYHVSQFQLSEREDIPEPMQSYSTARDVYRSLTDPNYVMDSPGLVFLDKKPMELLQNAGLEGDDLQKAQEFCSVMMEITNRKRLDEKYPSSRRPWQVFKRGK